MTSRLPKSSVSTFEPDLNTSLASDYAKASAPTSTSAGRLSYPTRGRRDVRSIRL